MITIEETMKDADGRAIFVGSVLREINDGDQGVVVKIGRKGGMGFMFEMVGDVTIQMRPGNYRVTNRYDQWRHVPRSEQTYEQRYLSWVSTPFDKRSAEMLYGESLSEDAQIAIGGILALLPEDAVDWEDGPWPDSIEQALRFLADHLTALPV